MKEEILRWMAVNPNLPCADGGCSTDNFVGALLGWVYIAVGAVAVGVIVFGGIQYMTSEGDPEKARKAQATITYTVIGMLIIFAATTIVGFVTGAFAE
jgi:hypothetical protein